MCRAWLAGILPMVLDTESSVHMRCVELMVMTIFNNIVPYDKSQSCEHHMAWSLIAFIADAEHVDFRFVYLVTLCRY
jgi:hypothetical protein